MKLDGLLFAVTLTGAVFFGSCASTNTDLDIKNDIEKKLKSTREMSGVTVDVANGIVSMTGECKDELCKADCEKIAQDVNGVKTVINNLTVPSVASAPPLAEPPAIDTAVGVSLIEDPLSQPVATVVKKFPSVNASVANGIITLTGSINKTDLPRLLKAMNALKPKKIEQKLSFIKKVPAKKKVKAKKRSKRR